VNGHCVYSFSSCIHRLEHNTLLDVEGDSFPPQAAAAYFHLYSIRCDDADYILEAFPIVRRKDEQAHGEYRTKRVILDIYDIMQQALEKGTPYHTCLSPPPAHGWIPPEARDVTTGGQGTRDKEDAANPVASFQQRAEPAMPQAKLDFML